MKMFELLLMILSLVHLVCFDLLAVNVVITAIRGKPQTLLVYSTEEHRNMDVTTFCHIALAEVLSIIQFSSVDILVPIVAFVTLSVHMYGSCGGFHGRAKDNNSNDESFGKVLRKLEGRKQN
jgi:hypothetical protein